jgi:hypothetical protein
MKMVFTTEREFEILEFRLEREPQGADRDAQTTSQSEPNNENHVISKVRISTVVVLGAMQLVMSTICVVAASV